MKTPKAILTLSPETLCQFSGETSISDFIAQVEDLSSLGEWDDEQKIAVAKIQMKGAAKQALNADQNMKTCKVWKDFTVKLVDRFAKTKIPGQAMYIFRQCQQRTDEPAREFIARLRKAANDTVTWTNDATKDAVLKSKLEEDAFEQLLEGLNPELALRVMGRDPADFTAACKNTLQEEINLLRVKKRLDTRTPDYEIKAIPKKEIAPTKFGQETQKFRNPRETQHVSYQPSNQYNKFRDQHKHVKFNQYNPRFNSHNINRQNGRLNSPSPNRPIARRTPPPREQVFRTQQNAERQRNSSSFGQRSWSPQNSPRNPNFSGYNQNKTAGGQCFRCGRYNHLARECSTRCFHCNQIGHIKKNCRSLNARRVTFGPERVAR